MDSNKPWKSVRKVRYFEDLEVSINFALKHQHSIFDKESFLTEIVKCRQNRHNLIQKHYRKSIVKTKKALYSTRFRITLPDTLTFLKEVKIFRINNGVVIPLELTQEIKNVNEINEKKNIILKYVLNSKYKAYTNFLKKIIEIDQFILPNEYLKRNNESTIYINKNGFLTDIASFYTIRDLFYELDVVNWYIDTDNNLVIYPTVSIDKEAKSQEWTELLKTDKMTLTLRKKINKKIFLESLVSIYMKLTNRRYNINAKLILLRDNFCKRFCIGDYYYKELLISSLKNDTYNIKLNFGLFTMQRKKNYDLKIVSLPKVTSNRLALYISIDKKGSG